MHTHGRKFGVEIFFLNCNVLSLLWIFKLTINRTAELVAKNLHALLHVGRYGSFSIVTGFMRKVFTEVSNSGRGSSSSSTFCKSHSHTMIACCLFHSSRKVVAKTYPCSYKFNVNWAMYFCILCSGHIKYIRRTIMLICSYSYFIFQMTG